MGRQGPENVKFRPFLNPIPKKKTPAVSGPFHEPHAEKAKTQIVFSTFYTELFSLTKIQIQLFLHSITKP